MQPGHSVSPHYVEDACGHGVVAVVYLDFDREQVDYLVLAPRLALSNTCTTCLLIPTIFSSSYGGR